MSGREATIQQQHKLIDKNRNLKQIKDGLVKREFELRRRVQEVRELAKFVKGREFEREVEGLRNEYEGMKDLVVEVGEKRERVGKCGEVEELKAVNEEMKTKMIELEMEREIQLSERERILKQFDYLEEYLASIERHKQSLSVPIDAH